MALDGVQTVELHFPDVGASVAPVVLS
jgi:hypothetical protein